MYHFAKIIGESVTIASLKMLVDSQENVEYDAKQISALLEDLNGVNKSVARSEKGD